MTTSCGVSNVASYNSLVWISVMTKMIRLFPLFSNNNCSFEQDKFALFVHCCKEVIPNICLIAGGARHECRSERIHAMDERNTQALTKATMVSLENSLVDSVFMQLQKALYITLHSQDRLKQMI
ncbi:hypothetical protein LWI28_012334 [Acer negundo]|uniref:Uncharacterized protein n=1 Tax=Acer negundo TaxID=4023 RepID=A0AAD5IHE3_ACENE|nr:hypothetical protein LWI28_012334 [Acer negundo]